jgi:replicative DNA helicase
MGFDCLVEKGCKMSTYNIEQAVLASVMFHDINDFNGAVNNAELKEEWFTTQPHKIIAKTIKKLREKNMTTSMEMVLHVLSKNNLHEAMYEVVNVCSSTPVGSHQTFNDYVNIIKNNLKDTKRRLV